MRVSLVAVALMLPITASCGQSWTSAEIYPALIDASVPPDTGKVAPCPPAPPGVRDIETISRYGEDRRENNSSVVDEEADQQYRADIKPIETFAKAITGRADDYVEGKSTAISDAQCALDWMARWATDDALLGKVNRQGEAVRKWELATFATTYIKIKDAPVDSGKLDDVRDWIHALAVKVRDDYSTGTDRESRQNNHLYWAAWSVAAAGIATGDRSLFDWGVDRYRFALTQIRDDGALPLELDRRTRAASYHMFALAPLVMLAEAGEANGIPLYAENGNRLQKLIELNIAATGDLSAIGKLNGFEQENLYSESSMSWMEPYYARTGDKRVIPWLMKYRPMGSRRLGGNMTALFAPDLEVTTSSLIHSRPSQAR